MGEILDPIIVNESKELHVDPATIRDIKFLIQKALAEYERGESDVNVYQTDYQGNELENDQELLKKLKAGDIINSLGDASIWFVNYVDEGTIIIIDLYGTIDYYTLSGDLWEFDHREDTIQPGTKLYKHEIVFSFSGASGSGAFNSQPIYVISDRATPFELNGLDIKLGVNAITMIDDNPAVGTLIYYDSGDESMYAYDANSQATSFSDISDFADTVTEL